MERSDENLAHTRHVEDCFACPCPLVAPQGTDLLLAVRISLVIGQHQEWIFVQQAVEKRTEEVLVAPSARAPDPMKSSTSRKEAFFSATSCGRYPRSFSSRTCSTVNPNRKKFSAPTSSRISTLAPSTVPMVMAPLSANFMFAGAAGLLAGHGDLFGQIPGRGRYAERSSR